MAKAYLGPASCHPLRRALWLGTGLLVCGALGRAKGVRQLQDAAVCQALFAQDPPPLKSTTAALGALQKHKRAPVVTLVIRAGPSSYADELPEADPLPVPSPACPTWEGSQSGCRLGRGWALGSDSLGPSTPRYCCCPEKAGECTPRSGSADRRHR